MAEKKDNFPRSDRGRRGERSHNGGPRPPAIAVPDHRQQDQQGTGHPQCGRQETRGEDLIVGQDDDDEVVMLMRQGPHKFER